MFDKTQEPATTIELGSVRYLLREGQLHDLCDNPLQIRAKSGQVLALLISKAGTIVSKDSLAESIWTQVIVTDESIAQCISDIRKVLGDDSHSILETFPKRGYRINAVYCEPPRSRWSAASNPLIIAAAIITLTLIPIAIFNEKGFSTTTTTKLVQPVNVDISIEIDRGRKALSKFTYEDNLIAERHFRTAIELDPQNALAYAELVAAFAIRLENGWAVLTRADEERAFFYAQKAIELKPRLWLAHYALGRLHAVTGGNLTLASEHLQHAMAIRPASDDARVYFAVVKIYQGAQDEAIPILEAVLASHPTPPFWYFLAYGHALFQAKRYEDAKAPLFTCLSQMPNAPYCLRFQIANFAQLGRLDDAEWAIEEYSASGQTATFSAIMDALQVRDSDNRKHFAAAFKKAGLRD